jgi:hypothetical protein
MDLLGVSYKGVQYKLYAYGIFSLGYVQRGFGFEKINNCNLLPGFSFGNQETMLSMWQ